MFGQQEPQPLLTCGAEHPVFNYWLGRLGGHRDSDALCGREGHQSYNWNKTIPVMRDKDFFLTPCVRQKEKVGAGK